MQLYELLRGVTVSVSETAPGMVSLEAEVVGITDDSRRVAPGWVFVCIQGRRFDGHSAVPEACARGAVAVVAETGRSLGVPHVAVEDTRAAYARLCANFYGNPASKLHLIGITGTNGKTTTAYLLKKIFDRAGIRAGLMGTLVNLIGEREVPTTLTTPDPWELQRWFAEMVAAGCTHCVMEVSSQALDQKRVAGLQFSVAVFSNLTCDHLDYHETFEAYQRAKQQLFRQCDCAIVNVDDDAGAVMLEALPPEARAATYSLGRNDVDYSAKNLRLQPDGVVYEMLWGERIERLRFDVPGTFSAYNSLAAACTALELGISFPVIQEVLAHSGGVRGRMECVHCGEFTVILDYAHTPDGLEKVLRALRGSTQGRLITVFGCGGERDASKRPLMGNITAEHSDVVIVSSDNPRGEDPRVIIEEILAGVPRGRGSVFVEPDRVAAVRLALQKARPGDLVLLAGKGQETYQILADKTIHLDEREIVAEFFREKKTKLKKSKEIEETEER